MTRSMTRSTRIVAGGAALAAVATLGLGGAVAHAAPAKPAAASCTFQYPNPNLNVVQGKSTAKIIPAGNGKIGVRLETDSMSFVGYKQDLGITWANLDTGRNGQAGTTARVAGPKNTLTVPDIATKRGRVALVISATNTGAFNPNANSYGDCSIEVRVR